MADSSNPRTRADHMAWVKERAHLEVDVADTPAEGIANAIASFTSDLRKHPETQGQAEFMNTMAMMQVMGQQLTTKAQMKEFIDGIG